MGLPQELMLLLAQMQPPSVYFSKSRVAKPKPVQPAGTTLPLSIKPPKKKACIPKASTAMRFRTNAATPLLI
jgi:hypothetical protein